jgi:hypothetical protein
MGYGYERPRRSIIDTVFNFLTTLVILTTMLIGGAIAAIYMNPYLPFNPFPPPTEAPPPTEPLPTHTPSSYLPPDWTKTPVPTVTLTPTFTLSPPTNTPPVASPAPTPLPYSLQPGTPAFTQNFLNDQGCAWMGVAGQVIGVEQGSSLDLWVKLGGQLAGNAVDYVSLPGSAPGYGEGGYEFVLSDQPVASENLLWIQLTDPSGNPKSEKIYLSTSDQCEENLVLINWIQTE